MYKTKLDRLNSLLINSASLKVIRGGLSLQAEGLLKGDDLLSPQGDVHFGWNVWPQEILDQAVALIGQLEKHIASCLSKQEQDLQDLAPRIRNLPEVVEEADPEEEDIASSFSLPSDQQPKQF